MKKECPPAGRENILLGAERTDEKPKGRYSPKDGDRPYNDGCKFRGEKLSTTVVFGYLHDGSLTHAMLLSRRIFRML